MAMNGYVLNTSNIWAHAMKRSVAPGTKIPLDELYEQYGVKHDLPEGQEFANWLRNVKLPDNHRWKIVLESESTEKIAEEVKPPAGKGKAENVTPFVDNSKMSIEDVVGLSVRQGREILPRVTDLKLLQYSLQEANKLAGKDSLCRILRKRIRELKTSR